MTHDRGKSNLQFLCLVHRFLLMYKPESQPLPEVLHCIALLYWYLLPPNPWSSHSLSPFLCSLLNFFFLNGSYPFSSNSLFLSYYCSLSSWQETLVFKNQSLGIKLSGLKFRLYHFLNIWPGDISLISHWFISFTWK